MPHLKSIHTIYRTLKLGKAGDKKKGIAPIQPVTEEIPPGKRFECSDVDADFFLKTGAAVRLGAEETYAPQTKSTEPVKEPEPKTESSLSEEVSGSLAGDSDRSDEASASDAAEDDLVG